MYANKIIDGHLDIAWNYQSLNRDFLASARDKSLYEEDRIKDIEGIATVGFPELCQANVGIVCGTIWVERESSSQPSLGKKYTTIEQAKSMAREQYSYYCSLERNSQIRIVRRQIDITQCLTSDMTVGIVMLIEGADFVENIEDLQDWYNRGVRIVAPVWEKNAYGGCANLGGCLTQKGKSLLKDMGKLGMVLDIAHMSRRCADDALSLYSGLVINSHTSCQMICPGERQASDEQIVQIHKRSGLIGLMLQDKILNQNNADAEFGDIFKHIDHIIQLTGCIDNVALGSSMDGGYGSLSLPKGMRNIGDLPEIADWLRINNCLSQTDIEKIMFRNWERVLLKAYTQ